METDKVKLNDQIVLLRKCIKVAKVHIVRRLFRQMKMLRQKKGKREEDTKKNQRKAERLKEEITIINKLNPDIISKMALKEDKDWNKVILQKDITTEERSFARLINHKKIQEKILQFRMTNPNWQSWLPSTLQHWERKKLSKIERMNSAVKDRLTNSEKEQNIDSDKEDKEMDLPKKKRREKTINEKHLIENEPSLDNTVKENKNKRKTSRKGKLKNSKFTTEAKEYESALSKFLEKPKDDIVNRVEGSLEISKINLDSLEDQETIPVHWISHVDKSVAADSNTKPKKKLRDPFFMGSDSDESGQESCSESERQLSNDEEQSPDKPKTQFISSLSGKNRNDFSQLRKRINPKFFPKEDQSTRYPNIRRPRSRTKTQFDETSHRNKRKFSSTRENHSSLIHSRRESTEDDRHGSQLHPSWEAKKKLKQAAILPFTGKRIQFSIND